MVQGSDFKLCQLDILAFKCLSCTEKKSNLSLAGMMSLESKLYEIVVNAGIL